MASTNVFDFTRFPTLTTEHLRLRQITEADAPAIIAIYGDPRGLVYINNPPVDTLLAAHNMIRWFEGNYQRQESIQWGIALRGEDTLIGACGTYEWDRESRHVDIGFQIVPDLWGRGYATEATRAMLRWCFDHFNLHRIQADCTEGNLASERVLLKCGFKVEGVWRESCWEHGRFVSIKQFGLLKREFAY